MDFKEFNTIEEYQEANINCHNILKDVDGYNSPIYANEKGILSINGTYLLPLVERFRKYLDLDWREFKDSYIKRVDI